MRKNLFFAFLVLSISSAYYSQTFAAEASAKKIFQAAFVPIVEKVIRGAAVLTAEAEKQAEQQAKNPTVTISFAGDCTLGSDLKYGKSGSFIEVFENQAEPFDYFLSNVKPVFEDDDLTVVNLEGPLTNVGIKAEKEFAFRGPPEFTGILKAGSVEIVNLANNHTYDYGAAGYADTLKNLDAAGIASFGVDTPYIVDINGIKTGFLGYKGLTVSTGMKNKIAGDIKSLRESGADVIVAMFHGGEEAVYYPNNVQKTLYRHACDSGADLVIGHHPHVVQGIEFYNGKYIVYSLGNFSFGGNRNPSDKDTFIFRQTFELASDTRKITGIVAEIVPCSVSSVANRNDFRPTPLYGDAAARVIDKIGRLSLGLNNNNDIFENIDIYEMAGD